MVHYTICQLIIALTPTKMSKFCLPLMCIFKELPIFTTYSFFRVQRVTACGSKVGKLNLVGGPEVRHFHPESFVFLNWIYSVDVFCPNCCFDDSHCSQ